MTDVWSERAEAVSRQRRRIARGRTSTCVVAVVRRRAGRDRARRRHGRRAHGACACGPPAARSSPSTPRRAWSPTSSAVPKSCRSPTAASTPSSRASHRTTSPTSGRRSREMARVRAVRRRRGHALRERGRARRPSGCAIPTHVRALLGGRVARATSRRPGLDVEEVELFVENGARSTTGSRGRAVRATRPTASARCSAIRSRTATTSTRRSCCEGRKR